MLRRAARSVHAAARRPFTRWVGETKHLTTAGAAIGDAVGRSLGTPRVGRPPLPLAVAVTQVIGALRRREPKEVGVATSRARSPKRTRTDSVTLRVARPSRPRDAPSRDGVVRPLIRALRRCVFRRLVGRLGGTPTAANGQAAPSCATKGPLSATRRGGASASLTPKAQRKPSRPMETLPRKRAARAARAREALRSAKQPTRKAGEAPMGATRRDDTRVSSPRVSRLTAPQP